MEDKNRMTICRKIKIYPVGDKEEISRVYDFIRNGQYTQYLACNLLMGQLVSEYYKYNRDIKNEDFKARQKEIMRGSNPLFDDIEFSTGIDTKSIVTQKVRLDFATALKNGLAKGERTVTNYKRTNPLLTNGRSLKFYYDYASYQEFLDKINDTDFKVYIKWVNKIKFKVIFGNPHKSQELRSVVKNIFEENYKVQGSSIEIDGKSIILNLCISIPKQIKELDENTVVGVDLGFTTVCALNNSYRSLIIGDKNDLLRVRVKLQEQRKRLQKSLRYTTSGGHGRRKKLRALERLKKSEKNFARTYCHMVSKKIVDFALKNKAKYINFENLEISEQNDLVLKNLNRADIQRYTIYKAEKYGIIVRMVKPVHSSELEHEVSEYDSDTDTEYKVHKSIARNVSKSTCYLSVS